MSSLTTLVYNLPQFLDQLMEQGEKSGGICTGEKLTAGPYPPIQLIEDEHTMQVRALLPGIPCSDVRVELVNNNLILSGDLPAARGSYYRQERPRGAFKRLIPLPCAVSDAPVTATLANGVLTILLPKDTPCPHRVIEVCPAEEGKRS